MLILFNMFNYVNIYEYSYMCMYLIVPSFKITIVCILRKYKFEMTELGIA